MTSTADGIFTSFYSYNIATGTHHHYPSCGYRCLLVVSNTQWKSCSEASHHAAVILIDSTQVSAALIQAFYFLLPWRSCLLRQQAAKWGQKPGETPLLAELCLCELELFVLLNTVYWHHILCVPVPYDKINSMYYTAIFIDQFSSYYKPNQQLCLNTMLHANNIQYILSTNLQLGYKKSTSHFLYNTYNDGHCQLNFSNRHKNVGFLLIFCFLMCSQGCFITIHN